MKTTYAPVSPQPEASSAVPSQPARVLIVDADESSRSVLSVALTREGFETSSASSSEEALRLLTPSHSLPQMVVVASELRKEDGFSLVAQLRSERRTSAMPVLLLARAEQAQIHELSRVVGVDEIVFKPAFARDIAVLARLQLAPAGKDQARTLLTEKMPISHLLRAVLATTRSGVIELESGRGHIAYRRGKILDASFDQVHGINALVRAISLARGEYRVIPRALAFDPAFHCTLKELVSVVFPRLQRWEELLGKNLPLDAKLAVDFGALARALPSMPDAINGVVRLFDGVRDVRQVVIDSPLDEAVTLEIATRLYLLGVVVAVAAKESGGLAKADPRLFEPRPSEAVERMDSLFDTNATPIQALAAAAEAGDDEWYRDAQGTGLEVGDPSEGWSTIQTGVLSPELEQQLAAFNIQPVVDPQQAPLFASDLLEFTAGETHSEQPIEAALTAPIPLIEVARAGPAPLQLAQLAGSVEEQSARALENEFFSITETETPKARQLAPVEVESVSKAVLGLNPPADVQHETAKFGGLLVACLLIMGTAITAWLLAQNPAEAPAPVAAIEQPAVAAASAAPPSVEVQPLEPEIEAPAAPEVDSSAALVEATRLYDTGKINEAVKALEELVTVDSSSPQAWMVLGLARYDSGNTAGAAEAANTVLALDPKVSRAHLLLATIQLDSNHRALANEEIQKYLDQDPNGPFADEAKALLKR